MDYDAFAALLVFSEEDLQRDRIHTEQVLPPEQLANIYPLGGERGAVGKVLGLHPTYRYLNRMFRKTIDCKGGDKGNIADYSRNLLHRMVLDAQPLVYSNSSSVRLGVLERGPSRAMVLLRT